MGLDKVLAISGKPGLYELTAQTRGGFVAKSMLDGKKIAVNMRHNVSILSEIAIYTYTEEIPLGEVFQKIKEKEDGGEALNHSDSYRDSLIIFLYQKFFMLNKKTGMKKAE